MVAGGGGQEGSLKKQEMIDAREIVKQVSVRGNLPGPHCREGTGFWWKCGHFLHRRERQVNVGKGEFQAENLKKQILILFYF